MPPIDGSQGEEKLAIILTNAKPEDGGNGPRNPEFESDDIVEPIKIKLGQYLNRTIAEAGNVYTFERGKSFQNELGASSPDAITAFDTISNSDLFTEFNINKTTRANPNTTNRAELYAEIDLDSNSALIPNSIARVQEENNRFSTNNPYVQSNGGASEETAGTRDFIPQQRFGEHTPRKWPDSDEQNNIPIKISQLKKLGTQILLESSGETSLGDNADQLGDSPANRASVVVVPGIARIGAKVPVSRFSAGTIMSRVNPTFSKPTISDLENDGPEKTSYGSPYNPLVRFNSLNTSSGLITATLLTMTVYSMSMALAAVLKNTSEMSRANTDKLTGKEKWMGSSLGQASSGLGNSKTRFSFQGNPGFFMLHKTSFDYTEVIKEGMKVFFDLSSRNPGFTVSNTQSPDFHNIVLRNLVRNSVDTFSENRLFGPLKSIKSDPSSLGKVIDNTEAIIENLRESKLFRFMNVIAQLGDISLMTSSKSENVSVGDYDSNFEDVISDTDYFDRFGTNIDQKSLILRNRLSSNATRPRSLTMASNNVLSMYRLPTEYTKAQTDFGMNSSVSNMLLGDRAMYFRESLNQRLQPEEIEAFERAMDAYYVPFYFQDLRTNEFVAFHAFLETVSDNFNTDYVEGEGMGRVGKTYSYKNTNRSINLSFHVVSTNKEDFDEMWFKINKLTTLLYPQYTKGREVTNLSNGHRFIQPFSQIVSSSPMIRLRVGDLIKSNFSELDLARLFGAGTNNFTISNSLAQQYDERNSRIQAKINEITTRQRRGLFEPQEVFRLVRPTSATVWGPFVELSRQQLRNLNREQQRQYQQARTAARRNRNSEELFEQTIQIPNGTVVKVNRVINSNAERSRVSYEISPLRPLAGIGAGAKGILELEIGEIQETIRIMPDEIRILAEQKIEPVEAPEIEAQTESARQQDIESFFSSENGEEGNPIVQAFQSTKGEGLAGFIKSMKFDWNGAIWETEQVGSKAPKFMKIDIDFGPVHDISPGLSSDGFMIGAPYNIGAIMQAIKSSRKKKRVDTQE